MLKFIIRWFIPNYEDVKNIEVRKNYGVLGGILGIICNLFLFIAKLVVGVVINSIAVISDAFNNLSDLGSAIVSIIGSRLSGKRADEEHPYGHGRAEYISALIIGVLIIFMGIELFKSSVSELLNPKPVNINIVSALILLVSVVVKLWMWHYNKYMGKQINSSILMSAAQDSLNDTVATLLVIASAIVAPFVAFPIDGIAGILVSVGIVWSGIGVAISTINTLIGAAPDSQLISQIEEMVMSGENVLGMHDLLVHDYGPGRTIASVHAEVPDNLSLIEVHEMIDVIEHKIMQEMGVDIVIHMDPVPQKK